MIYSIRSQLQTINISLFLSISSTSITTARISTMLFLAIPIDTFTGLSLDSTRHEIFPAYLAMHRTWGPSLVTDLHMGGIIMWVGGDTLMLLPMVPIALRWMHLEERRAVRVDRELDAILPEGRRVEPAQPVVGPPDVGAPA